MAGRAIDKFFALVFVLIIIACFCISVFYGLVIFAAAFIELIFLVVPVVFVCVLLIFFILLFYRIAVFLLNCFTSENENHED